MRTLVRAWAGAWDYAQCDVARGFVHMHKNAGWGCEERVRTMAPFRLIMGLSFIPAHAHKVAHGLTRRSDTDAHNTHTHTGRTHAPVRIVSVDETSLWRWRFCSRKTVTRYESAVLATRR